MNVIDPTAGTQVGRTIDQEADLLTSAILMVASGMARSTTIVGLRLADAAMAVARPLADDRGVILEPLWGPDEAICDVRARLATTH